jgi:predicted site-specific integrase-resolvase
MDTGTIIVPNEVEVNNTAAQPRVVIYARVSNQSRKLELNYQVERLEAYCIAKGYTIDKVYKEIASGMNDNRKTFWAMLDSSPTLIVVQNKDRLTRFGFNYLEKLLIKQGCTIEVAHKDKTDEADLMKDLVAVITSFCCRLYGMRRGLRKSKKIKEQIKNDLL